MSETTSKTPDEIKTALQETLTGHGATIKWGEVHRENDEVVGQVSLKWVESIFHKEVTLIDYSQPFRIKGRGTVVQQTIHFNYLGVSVTIHAHADVIDNDPHTVCLEARAEWHGGSVGTKQNCHQY